MKDYLGAYLFRVLHLALGFVGASLTARILGVAGRGQLAAAQTVIGLAVFLSGLGIPTGSSLFVARQPERVRQLLGAASLATFALSAVSCTILALFWAPQAQLGALTYAVYVGIAAQALLMLISYLLMGLGEVVLFSRLEVYVRAAWLLLLGGLMLFGTATPFWVLGLQQMAYVGGLVATLAVLLKLSPGWPKLDWPALHSVLGLSLRSYAGNIAGYLIGSQNLLLVQFYRGNEELGLFSSVTLLGNLLHQAPLALYPMIFREISLLQDVPSRWAKARSAIFWVTALSALAAVALHWTGPFLLRMIFGAPFVAGLPALPFILLSSVLMTFSMSCQAIVNTSGQPTSLMVANFLAVAVDLLLNMVLIPKFGFVGAAQASVASAAVWTVAVVGYLVYHCRAKKASPKQT